jgi:hypothetical protein
MRAESGRKQLVVISLRRCFVIEHLYVQGRNTRDGRRGYSDRWTRPNNVEERMAERTSWEKVESGGGQLLDQLKRLIEEGNIRRVVVKQGERVVAEFPLTIGVVGAVFAPVLAAVGALAALLTNCSIEVEKLTSEE